MNDMEYIEKVLTPEFLERFKGWNAEYPEERPLGVKAEFHGLHRKVMKIKGPLWDGVDASDWRESPRTILVEIIGHAMLALCDLDREASGNDRVIIRAESALEIHDHYDDHDRHSHPKHRGLSCTEYEDHTAALMASGKPDATGESAT